MELGRNYALRGKDVWAVVCENAALPADTAGTDRDRAGRKKLCFWVKKLLNGYGLQYLWTHAYASVHAGDVSEPPTSRQRMSPHPKGTLNCTIEGWGETLAAMQFLACSQCKPLTLTGFAEVHRNILQQVDEALEVSGATASDGPQDYLL